MAGGGAEGEQRQQNKKLNNISAGAMEKGMQYKRWGCDLNTMGRKGLSER